MGSPQSGIFSLGLVNHHWGSIVDVFINFWHVLGGRIDTAMTAARLVDFTPVIGPPGAVVDAHTYPGVGDPIVDIALVIIPC